MLERWININRKTQRLEQTVKKFSVQTEIKQRQAIRDALQEIQETGDSTRFGNDITELNYLNSKDKSELDATETERLENSLGRLVNGLGEGGAQLVYSTWLHKQNSLYNEK
jgi:hypothetical protein